MHTVLLRMLPSVLVGGLVAFGSAPAHAQIINSHLVDLSPLEIVDVGQTTLEAIAPAIVNLQVSEPFIIMATPPTPAGFTDPVGTQHTGYVSHYGNEVVHGNPLLISETGSVDIGVRMRVERPQAYPPGRYTYTVRLTVTPL